MFFSKIMEKICCRSDVGLYVSEVSYAAIGTWLIISSQTTEYLSSETSTTNLAIGIASLCSSALLSTIHCCLHKPIKDSALPEELKEVAVGSVQNYGSTTATI